MKKLISVFMLVSFFGAQIGTPLSWAMPQGYTGESSDITFDSTSEANTLIINATNDHAVVNFDSFNIAANETVRFNGANFLGRVNGGSGSDIFGSLFSNGQLILVNSNGITFHDSANVQVGSLIASTLDIQSSLYMNGELQFEKINGSNFGAILNQADITAADGGHIALLAESVKNEGVLTAHAGSVVLGVGEKQTISFDENNLINLVVDRGISLPQGSEIPLENTGSLIANGGKVILSLKTLDDVFTHLVNNSGIVEASRAVDRDGRIEFVSNTGIQSLGTIKTDEFYERGAAFNLGGNYWVGHASLDNLDGAVNLNTGNYTGITADNVDVIVNAAQVLTLTGDTEFNSDDDGNGTGSFTMGAGSSIVGAGFNLALQSAGNATLRSITGVGNLTIRKSGFGAATPTFTANNAITMTGDLSVTGTGLIFTSGANNITVGGNFTLGGGADSPVFNAPGDNDANTAAAETLLISGNLISVSGTLNHRNGIIEFNNAAGTSFITGSQGVDFWDLKCVTAGKTLQFATETYSVLSPNTFTLTGTNLGAGAVTITGGGAQFNFSGLSAGNVNWSNVVVSDFNNTGAYFTPGPGPITYGTGNSNIGPAIEAANNANAVQAGIAAVNTLPVISAASLGFGGGGGGSTKPKNSSSDNDSKKKKDLKAIADTESTVYVAEGVVAYKKSIDGKTDPKENLLYQGDVGRIDAYGRVKAQVRSVYVTTADGLKVVRGTVHNTLKEIPLGETPTDVVANKKGDTVYAAFPAAGNITPIDASQNEMQDPIDTGKGLSGVNSSLALSKDQEKIYVTNSVEDTVKEIDVKTGEVTKTMNTGSNPSQVIVADDGKLIISNTLDGTVSVMDAQSGKEISKLKAGDAPYGVALSEEFKELYVADAANNEIIVFDSNNFNEKHRLKSGSGPFKIQAIHQYLFVTNRAEDTLSVIDTQLKVEKAKIPVGKRPSGMSAIEDVDTAKIYIANALSGDVSLVKMDQNGNAKLTDTIAGGPGATAVAIISPEKPMRK